MKSLKYLSNIVLSFALTFCCLQMQGHDFSAKTPDGTVLSFNITDTTRNTVEVTYEGLYNRPAESSISGEIKIPTTISYKSKNYTVTGIGASAFSGLYKITVVELPVTIMYIGEYAFSNCTSLETVVFPVRQPKIEETSFWNCRSLRDIELGRNWTVADFKLFRWADSVKTISVPEYITKITGIRYLKNLVKINVSEENKVFSSNDGILYSKDKKTLYNCPAARSGEVVVPDGVVAVLRGSFRGCDAVTSVDLPSTINKLEYAEFFGMEALKKIVIRAEKPFITSSCDGKEVFALKVSSQISVYVPKKAIGDYKALLSSEAGVYQTIDGKDKDVCIKEQLLQPSKIKKIS
ncbi:MAG: leucine-rich repeat domain-containing protein [Bacteroidales bacterium]|nr:leucine-rich repeat domain-containing protein [Bacteroidales bacterium]